MISPQNEITEPTKNRQPGVIKRKQPEITNPNFRKFISSNKEPKDKTKESSTPTTPIQKYIEGTSSSSKKKQPEITNPNFRKFISSNKTKEPKDKTKESSTPTTPIQKYIAGQRSGVPIQEQKGIKIPRLVKSVWHAATPWNESKNESIVDYLKATPERLFHPVSESQEVLKTTYDSFESSPKWAQILWGVEVVKDKTGTYHRVVAGEAPMVSSAAPAKAAAKVATLGAEDVGMSAKQFARFLKARVRNPKLTPEKFTASELRSLSETKPDIDWREITKAIKQGKIKSAKTAADWAKRRAKRAAEGATRRATERAAKAAAEKAAKEAAEAARQARLTANWPTVKQKWVERMAEVVAMQPKAKKSITLGRIIGNNVVTATIALDMVQLSELYNKASTNQQNELLEAVSPEIKSAIKSDNWTKAQSLAQQEIDTQLNDAVQATTITKAELKQSQEAQPKPQPKPQVKPETKPQVKPETKPQVKPETKPQVKPKPQPKPETNAENGKDKSFPQKVRPANKSKKIKELTAEERKGAISWKQGTFWITIYPPYSQENVIHTKTRPQGTTIHKGKGSAKATVTTRGGKVDPLATIKMGIMNVEVLKGKDLIFSRREKKAPLLSGSYGRGRLLPGTVRRY
jgi:hypothetical protein